MSRESREYITLDAVKEHLANPNRRTPPDRHFRSDFYPAVWLYLPILLIGIWMLS